MYISKVLDSIKDNKSQEKDVFLLHSRPVKYWLDYTTQLQVTQCLIDRIGLINLG